MCFSYLHLRLRLGLGLAQYCWHQSYFQFRNKGIPISLEFQPVCSHNLKLVQSSTFVITMNKMIVRYKSIQLRLKSMTLHDLDVISIGETNKLSLGGLKGIH